MDWIKWVIPLVVVVVIILSNLSRSSRQEQKRTPRPPRPDGNPPAPRPRRTTGEVDRFLEEINRRRQETAEKRKAPPPLPSRASPPLREVPAPSVPVAMPTPQRNLPPPPLALPPQVKPVVQERPAQPSPRKRVDRDAPVARVTVPSLKDETPPPAPTVQSAAAPPRAPIAFPTQTTAPAASQLLQFLRSPQSLRAAFLLREVLDPPLSARHRKRRNDQNS